MSDGLAKKIVKAIIADFTSRRGLGDEWDQCDEDVQNEIRETWEDIVDAAIKEEPGP